MKEPPLSTRDHTALPDENVPVTAPRCVSQSSPRTAASQRLIRWAQRRPADLLGVLEYWSYPRAS